MHLRNIMRATLVWLVFGPSAGCRGTNCALSSNDDVQRIPARLKAEKDQAVEAGRPSYTWTSLPAHCCRIGSNGPTWGATPAVGPEIRLNGSQRGFRLEHTTKPTYQRHNLCASQPAELGISIAANPQCLGRRSPCALCSPKGARNCR